MNDQFKRLRQLPVLLLFLLPICSYAVEDLYVQNMTCSNAYPIQLQSITVECDDYCTLGSTATVGTWLYYSGVSMATTKVKVNVNFIPSVNLTKAYQNNYGYMNFGILSHDTHFSEVVDVCQDGYSCTNKGQFYYGFQYQLPSFGSDLNNIIDDYQLQFDIVSYDYDSYTASSSSSSNNMKVLGNCEIFLSSDNSTVRSTVYAKAYSSGYFLFAAALITTLAALSTLKKNDKKVFNCIDDDDTDIDAFQQMPSEFNCKDQKKHTVPEKIFELKNYVSSSATMFWEETHSWPRASSTLATPFAETTEGTNNDESSNSSIFTGLEDGILSGSLVSVSDVVENTSSLSQAQISLVEDRIEASFDGAAEGKEINDMDENKFFVDDMKIIPSVDKQDLKRMTLTETQSSSDDEDQEDKNEEVVKDVENGQKEAISTNEKKKVPTTIKKNSKKPTGSGKKKNNPKSSGSRFSIRKMFGGSSSCQKGFSKV